MLGTHCSKLYFFKQRTEYEIYQCDWSSAVCSSDLLSIAGAKAGNSASTAARNASENRCGVCMRSEERRVGKEGRSRWSPYHLKKETAGRTLVSGRGLEQQARHSEITMTWRV